MSNSIAVRNNDKNRRFATRRASAVVALLAAVCFSAPVAWGQCPAGATCWIGGATGNWSNSANWFGGVVPNSGTSALIDNANANGQGASAVTLNVNGSALNLTVDSDDSLSFNPGTALTLYGSSFTNNGSTVINGGGGANTFLVLDNNVTLSGGGTLTLTVAGGGGSAFIQQGVGGITLTNQSTIQGAGIIGQNGLSLINSGTVNANSSGQGLLLQSMSSGLINTGLLEGTNGGILNVNGVTVNNASGNITANGGTVQLYGGAVIQGGTLNTLNGGVLGTPSGNVAYLDGSTGAGAITINGTYTSDLNTDTYILGTITNNGNIQLNGGAATNSFLLIDSGNVTLQGGGTVTLSTATGGGNAFIQQATGGLTLTNVNNTIQGSGIIGQNGLTVVNQSGGIINANSTGGPLTTALTVQGATVTNAGLMEATNSGVLGINGVPVYNQGGTITAVGSGASVLFYGGTDIVGGTLTNNGGAFFGTPVGSVAYLDGSTQGALTINGTYTSDLDSTTRLYGTINNNGNFQLNGGNGTNSFVSIGNNVTLQGGGTLTLSTVAANGGDAFIQQAAGGLTLTNVDNTIQGSGIIGQNGLALVNQGTINANSTGSPEINTLTIQGAAVTNTGLMEATNSGVLQINGVIVSNAGGNIAANGAGASVQLFGNADIQGGALNNNGGAFVGTTANNVAFLDGSTGAGAVTLNGTYTSDFGSQTLALGTINNNNNFQLNGGGGTNSFLSIDSTNVMLQGGGTVTLSTATGGGNAFIQQAAGGLTLTNVDNTIQGSGIIGQNGLTVVNQATINANSTGGSQINTLTIQGASVINTGLMEATNSGVLQINGVVVNNAGGNVTANGGGASVQLFGGAYIEGGTLNNNGGAFFGTPTGNTAFLDGSTGSGAVTINGTYTSDLNTNTYLLGTINNKNNFQLNGGNGTNSQLLIDSGNVTLQGGGTVTLSTLTGGGNAFIDQAAGGLTLTNVDNTIQGSGIIGQNGLTVVNQATINANSTGGSQINTLTIQGASVINVGLMEATGSGVLQINGDVVNNAGGTITANPGASVQLFGSAVIQGGTLTNNGGTFFGTPQGYVAYLDGSTASGAVTINGTYTSDYDTDTFLLGTINNRGNIQLNGGSGTNSFLLVDSSSVTLQGGGTVTLSTAVGGGNAFLQQAAGGLTLENVDNTIQGNGIIGQNGLSLLNDVGGTILANVNGQNLYVNGGGTVTNNGTFQANPGSALVLQNVGFTNYAANTLTGGTYIINGTLSLPGTLQINALGNTGGEIVNNAAAIVLNGPNSNFLDAAGLNALSNFSNNTAAGSFTIQNGRNFTSPGAFSNAGAVTVGNGSTLTIAGTKAYTQSGGTTQGTGTIAGNVTVNGGTILPGEPNIPGTLTIGGNYTQNGGIFNELISSTANGLLTVSGAAVLGLGANLNIDLLGGFSPASGQMFTIMGFASGSGTFANAPASGFQMDGFNWTIAYNSNDIILNAVSPVGSLVTATWNSASGHWTTPTRWSCTPGPSNCVPNNNASNVYAAVLNSAGNTLTLDSTDSPTSIAVDTLTLTAGTLNIGSGATLNLVNNGLTDINANSGLILAGTFTHGSTSALAGLTSVEGSLTLQNQTITATPGGGSFTNSGTMNLQQTTALTIGGNLTNSGTIWTGNGASDTGNNSLTVSGALTNNWHIYMEGSGDSLTAANVTNSGTIELIGNNQTLADAGDFNNNGAFAYLETGGDKNTITVGGNLTNTAGYVEMLGTNGTMAVTGALSNSSGGLIQTGGALGTGNTLNANGGFMNAGTVAIISGNTLNVNGGLPAVQTGASSTALVNGTFNATGDFSLTDGTVSVGNGGALNVDTTLGAGGTGFNNSNGSVTIASGGSLMVNANSYTQSGAGASTSVNGTLTAANFTQANGNTEVNGTLTAASFTQTDGSTKVNGTLAAAVSLQGGTLSGSGTITGNVDNSGGNVHPFDPVIPTTLTINGNYTQGSGGTLTIDLGGTAAGDFSVLDVMGSALLGGTVDFTAINGFMPGPGDSFTFLLFGSESGNFANMVFTNWSCPVGSTCTDVFSAGKLTLEITGKQVIPEPSTLILFGQGLVGIAAYGLRKRRGAKRQA